MARGITETEVHSAADALVVGGERPTVERIRAHLGTGSPNTVVRWLDTWWKGLGERLEARRAGVNLPDAPEEVSELASQLWSVALAHADFAAKAALAADRVGGADNLSPRPLTPPCVPFGTRRFNRISAETRTGQGCCSIQPVRVFLLRLLAVHGHSLPCASRLSGNCLPPTPAIPVCPVG